MSDFPISQPNALSSSRWRSFNENHLSAVQEKIWLNLVFDQYPDDFVSCANTSSEVKTASQDPETCKMAYEYEWEHIYDRKVYIPISCCKCVE